jgi:hypothetical protein
MIAYLCNICGAWVIPGVSIDDLADHLLWNHPEKFPEFAGHEHYDARGELHYLPCDQEGLLCSIDCRGYFRQLEGIKVYKLWRPEQYDRIFLVFARSETEALERCLRGEAEFYHSPIQEHLWSNWKEVSGAYVWMDEGLTQGYEEVQDYERGCRETPGGTGGQGHVGVSGM